MITSLYIKNFILIKETRIDFASGMTSITGETGAGKSVLLGAIALILGGRADIKTIREGETKSVVEATFDISSLSDVKEILNREDLDAEDNTCTLRREILASGKSRAFINDTPVTAQQMRTLGERLVDIHSQHNNMLIGESSFQIAMLDVVGQNKDRLAGYRERLQRYKSLRKALQKREEELQRQSSEREYIEYQYKQLAEAHLKPLEEEDIQAILSQAQHSQEITEAVAKVVAFTEAENVPSVLFQVEEAVKAMQSVESYWSEAEEYAGRLESVKIELRELARECGQRIDSFGANPAQIEELTLRMDLIQTLLHKHKKENTAELLELQQSYETSLKAIENGSSELEELEVAVNTAYADVLTAAKELHRYRIEAAKALSDPLEKELKQLGVAGALFRIEVSLDETMLTENGMDQVRFLFSANNRSELRPINEIASGGEISRFMLALKAIIAMHSTLPTIIFDEIDTGVSGQIAERMGLMMRELGQRVQVITITHLPQIAALAQEQLRVYKREDDGGEYNTYIERLMPEERVKEIASMLSGSVLTEEAIHNAQVLLKQYKQ
ncbi:MAG: DNA repair protein RecN [Porphyromonas sp.]|nr:DNA repair protein RecN [Porphyromonas sp.]